MNALFLRASGNENAYNSLIHPKIKMIEIDETEIEDPDVTLNYAMPVGSST